jgi:uncharacterized protein YqgV (UPF0045/DUF77 family)
MSDKAFEWGSAEFAFQMPDNWPAAIGAIERAETQRRERERSWPVHQKTNYITRTTGRNMRHARDSIGQVGGEASELIKERRRHRKIKPRRRERVRMPLTLNQIVEQEREIFKAKFSNKSKNDEIKQINSDIGDAAKRVEIKEQKLKRDSDNLDLFIDTNNRRATEAIREAERHTRMRQQLVLSMVQLNKTISALVATNCKLDDRLTILIEYKDFCALVHHNMKSMKPVVSIEKQQSDDVCHIPFDSPAAIMKSIEDYEDRNLSLIGHFQQSQEELESIKKSHALTMQIMNRQMDMLKSHLIVIQTTCDRYLERAAELKFFCKMFESTSEGFDDQDKLLTVFSKKITDVYKRLVSSSELDIDELVMLTSIETRVEELLDIEEKIDESRVRDVQKRIDRARRLKEREDAARQIEDQQKQRAARANKRSNQVLEKRRGRKLVQRSKPKDTSQKKDTILVEEEDDEHHFFC